MYDVLIVEDDATLLRGLRDNFSAQGYHFAPHATERGARVCAGAATGPDPARHHASQAQRLRDLPQLRQRDLDMPILMLTAKARRKTLSAAFKWELTIT